MITVSDLSLKFGGRTLYEDVNLKFTPGNCYGVIGANGAGKSTFLKLLEGKLEPTTGSISIDPNERMSSLNQDHFAFDDFSVMDTVIQGHKELYQVMKDKDALYAKRSLVILTFFYSTNLLTVLTCTPLNGWKTS